jgi:hypothetical protein
MCKVMIMTNFPNAKGLESMIECTHAHITAHDNDGFGWAALGTKGVFGERSIEPTYRYRLGKLAHSVDLPIIKEGLYESFGAKSKIVGPLMFHGRTSTNTVNLLNTHPINVNGWSLIHNGVVTNNGPKYNMMTTNDTEHLVHYMSNDGIKAIEKYISGYYAFGAIDPNGLLHIVKDDIAPLYVAKVIGFDSYVFSTTIDLIEETFEQVKVKVGPIDIMKDNQHLIFNGNELVSASSIKPM